MSQEVLSIAIFEPLLGMEQEALADVRELMTVMQSRAYSRDCLYRNAASGNEYVLLRYWKSPQARRDALEDSEAQRLWAKLAQEINMLKVYESLKAFPDGAAPDHANPA